VHTRIMPDKRFRQHSRNSVFGFLRRCMSGLISLWIGIGFPIACLTLLYALHSRHNWVSSLMDKYPLLFVVTLASFIGPLLIVGWWMYGWQRKAPRQWHDAAPGKPADSQRHY
jgi:uncharacterized BrkB/YihY/UPF0761 family membrane protein